MGHWQPGLNLLAVINNVSWLRHGLHTKSGWLNWFVRSKRCIVLLLLFRTRFLE